MEHANANATVTNNIFWDVRTGVFPWTAGQNANYVANPAVNNAERNLIQAAEPDEARRPGPIPWGVVLGSPNVWLLGGVMTVSAILFYMQFQWYPTYLKEARGQTEQASG